MSNPSFSNIELWLFELAEGNLSPKQIEQLELFLLQHPELDVDRDVWEMAKVAKTPVAFPEEDKLIKKRPVGWFVGGSLAVTSLLVFGWFLLPGMSGSNDLQARSTDRKEVRVFVIQRDANSLQANNPNNDKEVLDANVSAPALTHTPLHTPTAWNPVTQLNHTNASVQTVAAVNANQQGEMQEFGTVEMNENGVQNPSQVGLSVTIAQTNGNTSETLPDLSTPELAWSPVDELPVANAGELHVSYSLEPAPMRFSREQLIYQEEALAHHFEERRTSNESNTETTSNAHPTYSSGYHTSLKSKLSTFGRKIQRMMDNPVALKNFKDPHYHVPGMLPTDINFSSAGTLLSTRVQSLSRLQWFGQENEQLINQLSFDSYAYALRGGVGLQLEHGLYRNGGISVASAAVTYSPKFSISRKVSVEPSLRFKMGNKTLANSKMQGVNQVEIDRGNDLAYYPESEPIGKMLWYRDMGAGLMVNTEWFFAGVQLDNLLRHYDNIYDVNIESARRAPLHFVATVGTDWVSKKETLSLSPYIVYQNNGALSEGWAGANFRFEWFTLGASVSTALEPAASVGLKFDHFTLTYNADYTKSVMTGNQSLSHQLTLRFVSKPSRFGKRLLNL
jgi:hypothetical protein